MYGRMLQLYGKLYRKLRRVFWQLFWLYRELYLWLLRLSCVRRDEL